MTQSPASALLFKCTKAMQKNFDNSISGFHKYNNDSTLDALFRLYLKYKFAYFNMLDNKDKDPEERINEMLNREREVLPSIGDHLRAWKRYAHKEKLVCRYRLSQMDKGKVEKRWYNASCNECRKWVNTRQNELDSLDSKVDNAKWKDIVDNVVMNVCNDPFIDFSEDHKLSRISKKSIGNLTERSAIVAELIQFPNRNLQKRSQRPKISFLGEECLNCYNNAEIHLQVAPDNLLDVDWLSSLSFDVMKEMFASGFGETEVIYYVLARIKEYFNCEVCDYLEIENDELVWRTGTISLGDLSNEYKKMSNEELKASIRNHESYGRGIGISGSVLLLDEDTEINIWNHIGSNNVQRDPRQSKDHKSAYEQDMYCSVLRNPQRKIHNFWIFPVFITGKLCGAFRVVNKTNRGGGLQPRGWPYVTRVQLAILAKWLSRLLETLRQQDYTKQDYVNIMRRNKDVDDLRNELDLRWISKTVFFSMVRHLINDINKKNEKRQVGCCIIISDNDEILNSGKYDEYPMISCDGGSILEPYDGLDAYHDAVNPLLGGYVFSGDGAFCRIIRLQVKRNEKECIGYEAIKELTSHKRVVCLILASGSKSILVFKSGKKVAEVRASERDGNWQVRYPEKLLKIMRSIVPDMKLKVLKIIRDSCIELSFRGHGAIIVVGKIDDSALRFQKSKFAFKSSNPITNIGMQYFVELAKMDGATFVSETGNVTRVNSFVDSIEAEKDMIHFKGRGARHKAGEMISRIAQEALVLIVSESRGISMIANGGKNGIIHKDM
jgi:DNA integrity scanning protein DisA with diadenylate cyclase activity